MDFEPVKGREQRGLRPALIIQNDLGNKSSDTTIVAAMTRTVPLKPYPFIVVVEPSDSGLSEPSTVNCAQVATIQQSGAQSRLRPPKDEDVVRPIGHLSGAKMAEVDQALKKSLGLH